MGGLEVGQHREQQPPQLPDLRVLSVHALHTHIYLPQVSDRVLTSDPSELALPGVGCLDGGEVSGDGGAQLPRHGVLTCQVAHPE